MPFGGACAQASAYVHFERASRRGNTRDVYVRVQRTEPRSATTDHIVQIFKGISSRRMRQEFLEVIKKYIWKEGTLWATGYYIASVADGVTTEAIQEYIQNQKSKAATQRRAIGQPGLGRKVRIP